MARKFKSMDGNTAAAYVSYAFTEVAHLPTTPSSPMADYADQWSAQGVKNTFGTTVKARSRCSPKLAQLVLFTVLSGALDHFLLTPLLRPLLMLPNMYKIEAGEFWCFQRNDRCKFQ